MAVITLTIYFPFWLKRQSKIINQLLPSNKIAEFWFPLGLTITILNFGMIIPEIMTDNDRSVVGVSNLFNKIDMLLTFIWIFKVRNRMNELLNSSSGDKNWYHGFWTFFFGLFYLQYKLNKIKAIDENSDTIVVEQSA